MVRETQIRDKLAKRLDLIAPSLDLIETEFHLQNASGTDGYIDILARDTIHQQLVVIELKKSNQAARQAIHELVKYTALLRIQHGVSDAKVRGILISTDWAELAVPFSAFKRETPFHVDGFRLTVSDDGDPISVDEAPLIPEGSALELNPARPIYLFTNIDKRDASIDALVNAFRMAGLEDFVAFTLDHKGNDPRVIYPYGFYVATSRLSSQERMRISKDVELEEIAVDNPWIYEDEARYTAWKLFHEQPLGELLDDIEFSYPENFGRLIAEWKQGPIFRFGRWRDDSVISDNDIFKHLSGVEGVSKQLFLNTSSPKFSASWIEFLKGLEKILRLNDSWKDSLFQYLACEVSACATVSACIHCPESIIGSVTGVAVYGNFIVLPWLDLVVSDRDSVKYLRGGLRWTGKVPSPQPRQFFAQEFEGIDEVLIRKLQGDHSAESKILSWLTLEYVLLETKNLVGSESALMREINCKSGRLCFKTPEQTAQTNHLLYYFIQNARFLTDLNNLISEVVMGEILPETTWISQFCE